VRIIDASNAGLVQLDRPRTPQQYGWLTQPELAVKYPQWVLPAQMLRYLCDRGYVGRRRIGRDARCGRPSQYRWEYNERHYVAYLRGRERFEKLVLKLLADNGRESAGHQVQALGRWNT